jgi:hypothetical protein
MGTINPKADARKRAKQRANAASGTALKMSHHNTDEENTRLKKKM